MFVMKRMSIVSLGLLSFLSFLPGCMTMSIDNNTQPNSPTQPGSADVSETSQALVFRGNAQRTGFFAGEGIQRAPKVIWSAGNTSDFYTSSPIVHKGIAYIGEKQGIFYALQLKSQKPLWSFQVEEPKFQVVNGEKQAHHTIRAPIVSGKYLYFTDTDSYLYALDTQKGTIQWKVKFGNGASDASPLVVGKTLYTTQGKSLYALEESTGNAKWSLQLSDELIADPAFADGIVYTGDYAGRVYAIQAETGRLLWKRQLPGGLSGTPAIYHEKLYVGIREQETGIETQTPHMFALDARTGEIEWSLRTGAQPNNGNVRGVGASVAIGYGKVYFCSYDGHLYALDAETGAVKWKYASSSYLSHSPIVSGGLVYFAGPDTDKEAGIYALDAEHGQARWIFRSVRPQVHFNNSFWIENNTLYFTGKTQSLYAIR
tara:strand:- start:1616 stop:2902 length:1287 start_codon:yes stop_codon:yes gene_type:complete